MPAVLWISGVVVALLAAGVHRVIVHNQKGSPTTVTTYVIGDLHGDHGCAQYWLQERLRLIAPAADNNNNSNRTFQWLQPDATVVFMGDYCDKGPYSYQTMQLVRQLQVEHPDRVTALMGNHELELLRDRHSSTATKYMTLAYSSVHPGEYLNFLNRPVDEQDLYVVDLLLNASLEVYARRWHQSILIAPDATSGRHAITELFDEHLRPVVAERLREYQTAYLSAFASNTTLGQWVEQLKIAHVENGVVFTHGGIHSQMADHIAQMGGIEALNAIVREHSNDRDFANFLKTHTAGQIAYQMLIYRGNHQPKACEDLSKVLETLQVDRLAVGHTPGESVRSQCQDTFWAVDSLLGRWIRTSGNFYCAPKRRSSQDGNFVCDDLVDSCHGQVIKITSGAIDIIS